MAMRKFELMAVGLALEPASDAMFFAKSMTSGSVEVTKAAALRSSSHVIELRLLMVTVTVLRSTDSLPR
jgi:hypothetical protein